MPDLSVLCEGFPSGHGPLGLLSSDEFLPGVEDFDRALLDLTGSNVAVILCADHRAAPQSARFAREHFDRLGARATVLDLHSAAPPMDFHLCYIAGGSPSALLTCLHSLPATDEVLQRWREGAGLAGSSAGAMALSVYCLTPEAGATVPTKWSAGIGPIETAALAVHASSRSREWLHKVARAAPVPLLALDDKTGVILRETGISSVTGPGDAWFVDDEKSGKN